MASVASIKSYHGGVAYSESKHVMLGLARTLREETRERSIRVTSVVPGATFTRSWEGTDLPEERFMPSGDIAAAVLNAWKLSDRTGMGEAILRPQLGDIQPAARRRAQKTTSSRGGGEVRLVSLEGGCWRGRRRASRSGRDDVVGRGAGSGASPRASVHQRV